MTTRTRTALEIAHGALLDLESAKREFSQLESLLFSAITAKEHPAHVRNLIEIAWNLAATAANTFYCNYEAASQSLDYLATQNAVIENVSRTTSEVRP